MNTMGNKKLQWFGRLKRVAKADDWRNLSVDTEELKMEQTNAKTSSTEWTVSVSLDGQNKDHEKDAQDKRDWKRRIEVSEVNSNTEKDWDRTAVFHKFVDILCNFWTVLGVYAVSYSEWVFASLSSL